MTEIRAQGSVSQLSTSSRGKHCLTDQMLISFMIHTRPLTCYMWDNDRAINLHPICTNKPHWHLLGDQKAIHLRGKSVEGFSLNPSFIASRWWLESYISISYEMVGHASRAFRTNVSQGSCFIIIYPMSPHRIFLTHNWKCYNLPITQFHWFVIKAYFHLCVSGFSVDCHSYQWTPY